MYSRLLEHLTYISQIYNLLNSELYRIGKNLYFINLRYAAVQKDSFNQQHQH